MIIKCGGLFANATMQVINLHPLASVAFKEIPDKNGCATLTFKAILPKCGVRLNVYEAKYKFASFLKLFTLPLSGLKYNFRFNSS